MRIVRGRTERGTIVSGEPMDEGHVRVLGVALDEQTLRFEPTGETARLVQRLAPIVPPNVLCAGRNYVPVAGTGATAESLPPLELFMKPTTAIIGPDERIVLPESSGTAAPETEVVAEGELAVVIGRRAARVHEMDALDFVLGYTVAGDLTDRRWQTKEGPPLWMRGKGFDTFCPLGPWLVTADEVGDPDRLAVRTRIEGEITRDGSTAQMVRSVAQLISEISRSITLLPGTVLLTGAPALVEPGADRVLRAGDGVRFEVERLGVLELPVGRD